MKAKTFKFLALLMVASMLLVACGTTTPEATEAPGDDTGDTGGEVEETEEPMEDMGPVTFDGYDTSDIPGLDPQIAEDVTSINYIENLFVHLTNYDLDTADIVPEAATSWDISDDGLTYTFYLRTDIPWVYHNPVTGETTQVERVIDEESGETAPAFVTAGDFVYGIKRACDPNIGSYYSSVILLRSRAVLRFLTTKTPALSPLSWWTPLA
jgi:ABC-type oligopeptide transport system substrate-binding subunit